MGPLRIFSMTCGFMLFGFLMFLAGFMSAYVVQDPVKKTAHENVVGRIGQLTAQTVQNAVSDTGAIMVSSALRRSPGRR